MALVRVRHFTLYLLDKKAATVNNVKFRINTNDAKQVGGEGYLTHSDGAPDASMSATEVTPVGGSTITEVLKKKVITKGEVPYSCFIGGDFYKGVMRVITAEFSSESASGAATGTLEMEGGMPEIVSLG